MVALALILGAAPPARAQVEVTVVISGIDSTLENNVRAYLSIEQQKQNPLLGPDQLRRLHRKAEAEIAAALQPYGYYRPEIDASLTQEGEEAWLTSYRIEPGPPIPLELFEFSLSSEMAADPEFEALVETRLPRTGTAFSHLEYQAFKASLSRLADERGYFEAEFTRHRVEVDLETYVVRVFLDYAGGPRYRYGELRLSQDVLDEDLAKRFVPFNRGEPYLLDRLIELQQALNNSDYFQSVEVAPGALDRDAVEVPIEVTLTRRARHRYDFGIGYGTDTGARASFGWRIPRVNRRGHRFDTELQVSEIGHSLIANYRVPVLNPRTDQIVYRAGEIEQNVEDSESLRREVGVSLQHGRGKWRETLSLDFQREDFTVGDDSDTSSLLIPGVAWSRTWGREFINVLEGVRLDVGLRGASEDFASDTGFVQLRGSLKFITSLGPRDRVIMRGAFGSTETTAFDEIPSSLRFFAGGGSSVRGYAYQSLGPTDADGEVIGGRYLLVGSAEYEHYFNDRWGVALFYDVGNAFDDIVDEIGDELESGVGFGLRWKSPIGPVRVDVANSISEDEEWRLHINIGPDL